MNPTVWPWRGHIVLDHDRFAFGGADNCCIDISEFVLPFGKITLRSVVQDGGIGQAKLIGRDRNQILHPIAPVNIQDLGNRPQPMCRIGVAGMGCVVFQTPHVMITGRVIHTVAPQIVVVCPFGVDHLSEQPLLSHVEGRHLEKVIATIFEHHAVATGLFSRID